MVGATKKEEAKAGPRAKHLAENGGAEEVEGAEEKLQAEEAAKAEGKGGEEGGKEEEEAEEVEPLCMQRKTRSVGGAAVA